MSGRRVCKVIFEKLLCNNMFDLCVCVQRCVPKYLNFNLIQYGYLINIKKTARCDDICFGRNICVDAFVVGVMYSSGRSFLFYRSETAIHV